MRVTRSKLCNGIYINWLYSGVTRLLSVPYRSVTGSPLGDDFCLEYALHDSAEDSINPMILTNEEVLALFSKYAMPTEDSFEPEKIEIRESKSITKLKGRDLKEDTRRIVVLGKGRLQYKVFRYAAPRHQRVSGEDASMLS